jgi:hypothetical protein
VSLESESELSIASLQGVPKFAKRFLERGRHLFVKTRVGFWEGRPAVTSDLGGAKPCSRHVSGRKDADGSEACNSN